MTKFYFSLSNYKAGLAAGLYNNPNALCPYFQIDPALYRKLETVDLRRVKISQAIDELRKRMSQTYFRSTYPLQMRTLDYSVRSFPAYRFILPEVMTEDWLAIVDWGRFQRDHILHQPLCGYVLLKLLDGSETGHPLILPNGKTFLDSCIDIILRWEETAYIRNFLMSCGIDEKDPLLDKKYPPTRQVWRALFRETAYIAAIFHDLGYPWQYAEGVQLNIDGINTPALRLNRSARKVVDLFSNRLIFYALNGYQKPDAVCPSTWFDKIIRLTDEALTKTHGLPGALGFLHLNDCVRQYPSATLSPFHLLCVEWAAVAIMMHDMKNIYLGQKYSELMLPENPFLRLSFNLDPLSSIVTLVDVIQEFERPAVQYGSLNNSVTLKYNKACLKTEFEIDPNGVLTLGFKMVNKKNLAIKLSYMEKERREYFDNQYGFLDMSSIGIKEVRFRAF
jgi:hypothetical protein